jgi:Leucine-rich repeat (LRR) protein
LKNILKLFFIFNAYIGIAQLTYVPDTNFEQALIALGLDDILDSYVSTENIKSIIRLDVRSKNITDLTGIEAFESLQNLYCQDNLITRLDVSANGALEVLWCKSNNLVSLDVSQNTSLTGLYCHENSITNLDVSANTALTILYCSNNSLTSLDINSNTSVTTLDCSYNSLASLDIKNGKNTSFSIFNSENNPNLVCIQVDSKTYMDANWSAGKDEDAKYNEDCSPLGFTYVPDTNFEKALIALGVDTVIDNYVATDQINSITTLIIPSKNINNLTGIEAFDSLIHLDCSTNNLKSLDLKENLFLVTLDCSNNIVTSLDLKENNSLVSFNCSSNNLTLLDVTMNTSLVSLNCSSNSLTGLDIKNGNNSNLTFFDAKSNPGLSCVDVDSKIYMDINWLNGIDSGSIFNEFCTIDIEGSTNIPDTNFEKALIALGVDDRLDNYVITDHIKSITRLNLISKNIEDLTGIEAFESLERLNCYDNLITSLDVSANIFLERLNCSSNNLTSLNVSSNSFLTSLYCQDNSIKNLDISANILLTILYCSDNYLTSLNIKNGKNTSFSTFNSENNPNLVCIQVDSKMYMDTNWSTAIDGISVYNEICSIANVEREVLNNLLIIIEDSQVKVTNASIKIEVYNYYGQKVLNSNLKGLYIVRLVAKNNNIRVVKLNIR